MYLGRYYEILGRYLANEFFGKLEESASVLQLNFLKENTTFINALYLFGFFCQMQFFKITTLFIVFFSLQSIQLQPQINQILINCRPKGVKSWLNLDCNLTTFGLFEITIQEIEINLEVVFGKILTF